MAGKQKFITITRCHVKSGQEQAARQLLEKELMPNDGKKPGDVIPGLVGFGLLKAKKDPSMFGIVTVWEDEQALDNFASTDKAKQADSLKNKLAQYCDGKIEGDGFYAEGF